LGSMNEFEHTLMSKLASKDMTLSELAERIGYEPLFLQNIVSGKDRSVPVNFFVEVAEVFGLSNEEKDELVRSWAFGVERWY
jgi:transcriptional regulator with XRE-family HTH domain